MPQERSECTRAENSAIEERYTTTKSVSDTQIAFQKMSIFERPPSGSRAVVGDDVT